MKKSLNINKKFKKLGFSLYGSSGPEFMFINKNTNILVKMNMKTEEFFVCESETKLNITWIPFELLELIYSIMKRAHDINNRVCDYNENESVRGE